MSGNKVMSSCHELTLVWRDGREETVPASEDEAFLEMTESAGIGLPFGCRTGAFATCTGRVVDGCVEYGRPPRALKSRHLDAGYALLCIAEPRTDCRIEVGVHVQTNLVSNPWK